MWKRASSGSGGSASSFTPSQRGLVNRSNGATIQFTIDLSKKYLVVFNTLTTFSQAMYAAGDGTMSMIYIDKGAINVINDESYTKTTEPKYCYMTWDLTGTTLTVTNHLTQYGEITIIEVA